MADTSNRAAEQAGNCFGDLLAASMHDRNDRISQAMRGIGELALGFARTMSGAGMPIDRISELVPDIISGSNLPLIEQRNYPVWAVVKETDLSGRPLIHANLGTETCSYSLLSDTPDNFRMEYRPVDIAELPDLKVDGYQGRQRLSYSETAVAVTAAGELILANCHLPDVDTSYHSSPIFREHRQYHVAPRGVQPDNLFDTQAIISPNKLVDAMERRLCDALKRYQAAQVVAQLSGSYGSAAADYSITTRQVNNPAYQPPAKRRWRLGSR